LTSSFLFSIGATFTAEPLKPVISFWGRQLSLDFDVRFAPYSQVEQTLLDSHGEFAVNTHGINIIAIRLEDFGAFDISRIRKNIDHFLDVLRSAHMGAPAILCLCPASRAFQEDVDRVRAAQDMSGRITSGLSDIPGVHLVHHQQIADLYPVENYEAPGGGQLGHIPYTETYYAALGTALVRRAHAITRRPYKVIALDCDDTLWKGICGEDGPTGVTLDEPRRDLQQFMLEQREAGMLLTMASKNNEPDVIEVFERNPGMPLQLRHFVAWRINWQSKAQNLAALAKELDLGLDSFIFVDDNPKECAEVESSASEVLSVPLPIAIEETRHFLNHVWAFDRPVVTAEDSKRSAYYEQNRRFGAEMRRTSSLEQFVAGLALKLRIATLTPEQLPRVSQLTQRTNQFNFTTIRRSEADIQRLLEEGGCECLTVDVSDRFGDYGLTGAVLFAKHGAELIIDTFLLSCRVLGRGVEHRIMAALAETAVERGARTVVARLLPTERNAPAQQFLDSIGAAVRSESGGVFTYRFPVESIRGIEWKPAAADPAPVGKARARAAKQWTPEYVRIARTLSTPAQIVSEMRRESRSAMAAPTVDPPSTETERRLAEIWADLLHAPSISASDNFFDLGGHSLLAVLLLARIQEIFGIELSIDDVYSGALTLADLAQRIDMPQLGNPDSSEYAELLREIEALSDEEARRLLAEGEPEAGCGYS
jgi:FkbH-like protein